MLLTRRTFLAGAAGASVPLRAGDHGGPLSGCACAEKPVVSLVKGENRRRNVFNALSAIDEKLLPALRLKKRVLIKPNIVCGSGWTGAFNRLAVTNADALLGILDYLADRWRGPVTIAEASADDTTANYAAYGYAAALREYRNIEFVDFNVEGRYDLIHLIDRNLRIKPVRLASRLFDPEAFIVSTAMMKTHNVVVATLAVKNMVMGAPLHNKTGETAWNDKRWFHEGVRNSNYSMFLTAQKLAPFWGVAVIDGFEGMEGEGPTAGTAVPSRIAIASTDFIAADRVGVECMGIDPTWIGYLGYCGQAGIGQWNLAGIEVRGEAPEIVRRRYALHPEVEKMKLWLADQPDCATSTTNPCMG